MESPDASRPAESIQTLIPIIQERLDALNDVIKTTCEQHQQPLPQLVAVSKYASLAQVEAAFQVGLRHFGENKVQDILQKQHDLPLPVTNVIQWHFIGHLQKNKINKLIDAQVDCIHSVDSLELAQRLSKALVETDQPAQRILLQVNLTQAPSQSGFNRELLVTQMSQLQQLPQLDIDGLMTIGPNPVLPDASKACFEQLAHLRQTLQQESGLALKELSMGMSQDFVHALPYGATIIRIGSHLFTSSTMHPVR